MAVVYRGRSIVEGLCLRLEKARLLERHFHRSLAVCRRAVAKLAVLVAARTIGAAFDDGTAVGAARGEDCWSGRKPTEWRRNAGGSDVIPSSPAVVCTVPKCASLYWIPAKAW